MKTPLLLCGFLLAATTPSPANDDIQIQCADGGSVRTENDITTATGNVVAQFSGMTVRADKVVCDRRTGELRLYSIGDGGRTYVFIATLKRTQ